MLCVFFCLCFLKKVNRNYLTQLDKIIAGVRLQVGGGCWCPGRSHLVFPLGLLGSCATAPDTFLGGAITSGSCGFPARAQPGVVAFGSMKEQSSCWRLEPWPPCSASVSYKTHSSIPVYNQDLLFAAGNALFQGL